MIIVFSEVSDLLYENGVVIVRWWLKFIVIRFIMDVDLIRMLIFV